MRASPHSRDWSLWVGMLSIGVAAAATVIRWSSGGLEGLGDLGAIWSEAFPKGPWRVILWCGVALGAGAPLLSLILGRWLSRQQHSSVVGSASARGSVHATVLEVQRGVEASLAAQEPNVPRIIDEVLRGALMVGASDIHFSPFAAGLRITYRVDGILHDVVSLSTIVANRAVARLKVLAYLDIYAREPQDGSLRRLVGEVAVEARVSCLPANHGERVVLRLVRGAETVATLRELGFERSVWQKMEELLQKPQGMIYVSGPVGSGKTTTLYSALQHIHLSRGETTSLVTLEDPIEMQIPFATQTQINPKVGLGFAPTLRSVLRQDPGAIMLGEIRDRETAEIATQAGLTGHLILTTLHVQSAAGTFDRLLEMGVERFVLSSSCLGSLAQRLVRSLCVECRQERTPAVDISERFRSLGHPLPERVYFEPLGCAVCEGRGYSGRLPVAELLVMSDNVRAALQRSAAVEEIHQLAQADGMVTLLQAAMRHAEGGRTSLQEVLRVAG